MSSTVVARKLDGGAVVGYRKIILSADESQVLYYGTLEDTPGKALIAQTLFSPEQYRQMRSPPTRQKRRRRK